MKPQTLAQRTLTLGLARDALAGTRSAIVALRSQFDRNRIAVSLRDRSSRFRATTMVDEERAVAAEAERILRDLIESAVREAADLEASIADLELFIGRDTAAAKIMREAREQGMDMVARKRQHRRTP